MAISPVHLELLLQQTGFILAHALGVSPRPGLCLPRTPLDVDWDQSHSIHFRRMQLPFVTRILGKDLCSWFGVVCVCVFPFLLLLRLFVTIITCSLPLGVYENFLSVQNENNGSKITSKTKE